MEKRGVFYVYSCVACVTLFVCRVQLYVKYTNSFPSICGTDTRAEKNETPLWLGIIYVYRNGSSSSYYSTGVLRVYICLPPKLAITPSILTNVRTYRCICLVSYSAVYAVGSVIWPTRVSGALCCLRNAHSFGWMKITNRMTALARAHMTMPTPTARRDIARRHTALRKSVPDRVWLGPCNLRFHYISVECWQPTMHPPTFLADSQCSLHLCRSFAVFDPSYVRWIRGWIE